jgi:ribokinase
MSVLVVGSYNLDRVFACERLPEPGATVAARYREGAGGKGFNQAVAARRLGAKVRFLAAIGRDPAGQRARILAAAEGVAAEWVDSEAPTGCAGIFLDREGGNAIAVALGANLDLSPGALEARLGSLPAPRVLLTQLEIPPETAALALRWGQRQGALTLLDPAPPLADPELLALPHLLKPNAEEFRALLAGLGETLPPGPLLALGEETLHALCRRLTPATVILTLGAEGVFVSHGMDRFGDPHPFYRVPAAPARVRDTVAAGDCFAGALAAFLGEQPSRPLASAIAFAAAAAARKCERPGAALAMPRREEL